LPDLLAVFNQVCYNARRALAAEARWQSVGMVGMPSLAFLPKLDAGGRLMEIKVENMKRCELVTLSGQIDSATAPDLQQALQDLIEGGSRNLVVNLRDVDFISSPGLTALLSARIKLRRKVPPGEVALSEISPRLRETFELVGFHHLFQFFESDLNAVGSF
jgi:anti-sigma B factor antagonist